MSYKDIQLINPESEYEMEGYNPEMDEGYNPGLGSELILAEGTANPKARRAMRLAGKFRREGSNPSDALSEAWSQINGGSNPTSDDDVFGLIVIGSFLGVMIYRAAKGSWPWDLIGSRRLTRPIRRLQLTGPQHIGQTKQPAQFDYAKARSSEPMYKAKRPEEETTFFLMP